MTGKDEASKKALFQQCQQLALLLCHLVELTEAEMKLSLRDHREYMVGKCKTISRIVMPQPEAVFEKKGLFKYCKQQSMSSQH